MGYVVHKIINFKKIMMPDNIVCNSKANHVEGNMGWKYVTCKNCLKKNIR